MFSVSAFPFKCAINNTFVLVLLSARASYT